VRSVRACQNCYPSATPARTDGFRPTNIESSDDQRFLGCGAISALYTRSSSSDAAVARPPERAHAVTLEEIELALQQAPNISAAAKILQIHRSHLYRLIRHFGINHRAKDAADGDQ
jgi:DNA-binding NtrC family response regulator